MLRTYNINKGKRAEYRGILGEICGFNRTLNLLIMRIYPKKNLKYGLTKKDITLDKGTLMSNTNNRHGYLYVSVKDIINN